MEDTKQISQKFESYKLNFEPRREYLYSIVEKGEDSIEVSKEFWQRILTYCEEQNYNKVLIEEDLDGNLSYPESYELSVWLTKLKFENIVVGFVDRHLDHQELNRFGELIATNRGFRMVVFDSVDEAEKWLLSQ